MWGEGTERKLATFARQIRTPVAQIRSEWFAQYLKHREAYLETLPETSRIGRLIWIHARKKARDSARA